MSKFILPAERLPQAFPQNVYKNGKLYTTINSCVTCSIVKVMEVLYSIKMGSYTPLSKGYAYVKHSGTSEGGTAVKLVLNSMMQTKKGTVPQAMCEDYNEKPYICEVINSRTDISLLDSEAEKWSIKKWGNIKANNKKEFLQGVKNYLDKYQLPLIGELDKSRVNHCVVIAGYDDEKNEIYYHDHTLSGEIEKAKYDRWLPASLVYIEIGDEDKMWKEFTAETFSEYIRNFAFTRDIKTIQLHHTYSPSYKNFNGKNHQALQNGMRDYHVNDAGYSDIAQNLTIFPDGKILLGRDLNVKPAGIKNANTGGICIECIGDFSIGKDEMNAEQKEAIIKVCTAILKKCNLKGNKAIRYHAWYAPGGTYLGTYHAVLSQKACPGEAFFGGNTREAFEKNLLPLLKEEEKLKKVDSINDIIWVLAAHKVITDSKLWMEKCEEDTNIYWLCYKMANKLQGTL